MKVNFRLLQRDFANRITLCCLTIQVFYTLSLFKFWVSVRTVQLAKFIPNLQRIVIFDVMKPDMLVAVSRRYNVIMRENIGFYGSWGSLF